MLKVQCATHSPGFNQNALWIVAEHSTSAVHIYHQSQTAINLSLRARIELWRDYWKAFFCAFHTTISCSVVDAVANCVCGRPSLTLQALGLIIALNETPPGRYRLLWETPVTRKNIDMAILEEMREAGDYDRLWRSLPEDWAAGDPFDAEMARVRLMAAEIHGRAGRIDEMEAALSPYLESMDQVPFLVAGRVLLMISVFRNRRSEPAEALRVALQAKAVANGQGDEFTFAEATQAQGQALWSMDRWDEAAAQFQESVIIYGGQARAYRLGVAFLCYGSVLERIGRVEDARESLERAIRMLLKSRDDYSLAVARVNIALALNAMGEYETSLKYLQFAHDAFVQMGHKLYTVITLSNIASALIFMKDYSRAESYLSHAVEVADVQCYTQLASTFEIRGRLHLSRHEWDKSEKALQAAVEIAEQAGSKSQRAEANRTLGRLHLALHNEIEAAAALRDSLDAAEDLQAQLLELEVKALLAQAICASKPVEAASMITEVGAALKQRNLPELKKIWQAASKQLESLGHEHYFIISDSSMPTLAEARISMLKWLWARALYKAKGNAKEAAAQLDVTPTYIRKLTKLIPRDLLRPGRKRAKKT